MIRNSCLPSRLELFSFSCSLLFTLLRKIKDPDSFSECDPVWLCREIFCNQQCLTGLETIPVATNICPRNIHCIIAGFDFLSRAGVIDKIEPRQFIVGFREWWEEKRRNVDGDGSGWADDLRSVSDQSSSPQLLVFPPHLPVKQCHSHLQSSPGTGQSSSMFQLFPKCYPLFFNHFKILVEFSKFPPKI